MTSEYSIITNKEQNSGQNGHMNQQNLKVTILKPALTSYSSRSTVINNRPTIIECGIVLWRRYRLFQILTDLLIRYPCYMMRDLTLLGEVVSEVGINKMGITKKEAKEHFGSEQNNTKSERAVEFLPIHIFFEFVLQKFRIKAQEKKALHQKEI